MLSTWWHFWCHSNPGQSQETRTTVSSSYSTTTLCPSGNSPLLDATLRMRRAPGTYSRTCKASLHPLDLLERA